MGTDYSGLRAEFWKEFVKATPEIGSKRSSWEHAVPLCGREDIILIFSLSQDKSSIYLKPSTPAARKLLEERARQFLRVTGQFPAPTKDGHKTRYWYRSDFQPDFSKRDAWPELIETFRTRFHAYEAALKGEPT